MKTSYQRRLRLDNGNGFGGYGETVFGTDGTLLLEKEKEALFSRTHFVSDKTRVAKAKDGSKYPLTLVKDPAGEPISKAIAEQAIGEDVSRGYTEEEEHWAWAIRNPDSDNPVHCRPKVALADAVIALTTNISIKNGARIDFKKDGSTSRTTRPPKTSNQT